MNTIIAGSPVKLSVTVQLNGAPVAIAGALEARLFTMDGKNLLAGAKAVESTAPGANWAKGLVVAQFEAAETASLVPGPVMLVLSGEMGLRRFQVTVESLFEPTRTSLFIKDIVVDEIRRDRLMAAASGILQGIQVSDDYLWDKIRAAESEIGHTLRVPLVPTRFFPHKPTDAQIADLEGMAWEVEIGTDYTQDFFSGDRWGFIATRQKPIISIERLQFAYPSQAGVFSEIPLEWLNFDAKYGHIRIVPGTAAAVTMTGGFMMASTANGRLIPSMVQLTYTAGLTNVATTFPELLDVIKKMAVLKIVGDTFLPQSGSISGDGLSESISVDMGAYHESIDIILNGPKGSNGGLMTKIHGIRTMVMG